MIVTGATRSVVLYGETGVAVVTFGPRGNVTGLYDMFLPLGETEWNLSVRWRMTDCVEVSDKAARRGPWW